ncbi:MAG: S9 family peptidase [Acidobacteria bacterium]|nr:MAG: S9 family peptidase [Acidobacteriota bacterium]
MSLIRRVSALPVLLGFSAALLLAQPNRRPISFDDFIALDVVSDLQLSPDGRVAAFVVTDYSLQANRGNSDIWVVSVKDRTEARQLTKSPGPDSQPRWSPDGKQLAFVSDRDGSSQIYLIPTAGGEAKKASKLDVSPANLTWSPDGSSIAFSADVSWPKQAEDTLPTQAKVWDELFYRHWNEWRVGVRSHLFLLDLKTGDTRDLTPVDADFPTLALGGYQDLTFTPDGKSIAVVANLDPNRAASTNNDILLIPVEGGAPADLTKANPSNDNNPLFSPDRKWMAYRAQMRPGFEADRQRLMLMNWETREVRDVTPDWQLGVDEIVWSPDSRFIYAEVEEQARNVFYRISIPDGKRERIVKEGHNQSLRITPDGNTIICLRETAQSPDQVYAVDLSGGSARQLSQINAKALSQLEMNPVEDFWFTGAKNERVHGLLLKPPAFNPNQKYPLVYLIHGGPQGAMQDSFHARWNYQMFAAPGYVVAMVNFHGSTGYGQEFTDSISSHWGDYPYEDLMKGLDYLLVQYPFIDSTRLAAAGASYGGYMVYWLGTQTKRFKCLVAHDGVYNPESMYGATEELWFPEWDFGGTPWTSRETYRKWSPQNFAQNYSTPMLVVHGQLDYRVDVSQGFEAFTALRKHGVPARFLYFPDEGHWVLKPRNRRLWWNEVMAWLAKYLNAGDSR